MAGLIISQGNSSDPISRRNVAEEGFDDLVFDWDGEEDFLCIERVIRENYFFAGRFPDPERTDTCLLDGFVLRLLEASKSLAFFNSGNPMLSRRSI